jgi:hypothetical protein
LAVVDFQSNAIAVRREDSSLQIRKIVGDSADLFSAAINPNQLPVAAATVSQNQQLVAER